MDRVCSGPYDEAYALETGKIGRVHVHVGLPQRYMFTSMALVQVALERIADETMGEEAVAVRRAVSSASSSSPMPRVKCCNISSRPV